jgi:hypothetical protein
MGNYTTSKVLESKLGLLISQLSKSMMKSVLTQLTNSKIAGYTHVLGPEGCYALTNVPQVAASRACFSIIKKVNRRGVAVVVWILLSAP